MTLRPHSLKKNSKSWTSSANQDTFILDSQYKVGQDYLSVYVNGIKQVNQLNYVELNSTSFKLSEQLPAGILVQAEWFEIPKKSRNLYHHGEEHYEGGNDELDISKLKGYKDLGIGESKNYWDITTKSISDRAKLVEKSLIENSANVLWFGALGDGKADDTSAIQRALDSKYSTIYIPDGVYVINGVNNSNDNPTTGGLSIKTDKTLILSKSATLKVSPNSSKSYHIIRVADSARVSISGGTLLGDRTTHSGTTGEWGYGIILNGSSEVSISNMTIKDFWGDAIFINSGISDVLTPCKNITISNCILSNNRRQGISAQSVDGLLIDNCVIKDTEGTAPSSGIDLEAWDDKYSVINVNITNNRFSNNSDGVQVNPRSSNITVVGNTFVGNRKRAISLYKSSNVLVSDNKFTSNIEDVVSITTSTNTTIRDNTISGSRSGILTSGTCSRLLILSNMISSMSSKAISLAATDNSTVSHNTINSCQDNGVNIYSCSSVSVSDNTIESTKRAIQVEGASKLVLIESNKLMSNNQEGIRVEGCVDITIGSNLLHSNGKLTTNTYDQVFLYKSTYCVIKSNTIRVGTLSNKSRYAIRIDDVETVGTVIMSNDLYQSASLADISDKGSTTSKLGNRIMEGTIV
ncbi:hypothetical protein HSE3_gp090 [Bacillus phage vB_BceM-HSE3]|nr:hypothetical protein HSE3_gp090 [Bacillus phage vB_BceM-HSE3]